MWVSGLISNLSGHLSLTAAQTQHIHLSNRNSSPPAHYLTPNFFSYLPVVVRYNTIPQLPKTETWRVSLKCWALNWFQIVLILHLCITVESVSSFPSTLLLPEFWISQVLINSAHLASLSSFCLSSRYYWMIHVSSLCTRPCLSGWSYWDTHLPCCGLWHACVTVVGLALLSLWISCASVMLGTLEICSFILCTCFTHINSLSLLLAVVFSPAVQTFSKSGPAHSISAAPLHLGVSVSHINKRHNTLITSENYFKSRTPRINVIINYIVTGSYSYSNIILLFVRHSIVAAEPVGLPKFFFVQCSLISTVRIVIFNVCKLINNSICILVTDEKILKVRYSINEVWQQDLESIIFLRALSGKKNLLT